MSYTVVGLGNPGDLHKNTRHNTGRIILEGVRETYNFPEWRSDAKLSGLVSEGSIMGEEVVLLMPETYMNNSGVSVKKAVSASPEKLIVIHDDLDLPIGSFKLSFNRGAGGNKGVASIISKLGTKAFIRVRVGISPTTFLGKFIKPRNESFVLKQFSRGDRKKIDEVGKEIQGAIEAVIKEGREVAMNKFN